MGEGVEKAMAREELQHAYTMGWVLLRKKSMWAGGKNIELLPQVNIYIWGMSAISYVSAAHGDK